MIELLEVKNFTIDEDTFPFELEKHIKISKQDLNGEFVRQPELYAYYSTSYELALDYEQKCKAMLERTYAQQDYVARENMRQASIKFTEKMVENTVICSDEYVGAYEMYLDAKKQVGLLRAAKDALEHKRSMLISLGANLRAEGNMDISINDPMVGVKKVLSVK